MAGCGKFFEGRPPEMYKALIEILGKLPHDTVSTKHHNFKIFFFINKCIQISLFQVALNINNIIVIIN